LIVNKIVIVNEVIDEVKRYNPQPTSRGFSRLKSIIDKMPLMIPMTHIKIVIATLTFTVRGCSDNFVCRLNSYPNISSNVAPRPFV
jgi:hypothetical protein